MKTAISIPKEDYELIEKMRKETGKSRSEIIVQAFQEWAKKKREEEADRQYAEAYKRMPETKEELEELKAWQKLSEGVAKDYPW